MAHGLLYNNTIKHDDIVDFKAVTYIPNGKRGLYFAHYQFVWEIYKEVANKHGIAIPKFWVCADPYLRNSGRTRRSFNKFRLEPLGPTINVDGNYTISNQYNSSSPKGSVLYGVNWVDMAERFFMVKGTAHSALSRSNRIHHQLLCEKWRAKSIRLTDSK